MTAPVVIDSGTRAAWGFLPATAPPGTVWRGPLGELLIITAVGGADELHQGAAPWNKSISADPAARRAR